MHPYLRVAGDTLIRNASSSVINNKLVPQLTAALELYELLLVTSGIAEASDDSGQGGKVLLNNPAFSICQTSDSYSQEIIEGVYKEDGTVPGASS